MLFAEQASRLTPAGNRWAGITQQARPILILGGSLDGQMRWTRNLPWYFTLPPIHPPQYLHVWPWRTSHPSRSLYLPGSFYTDCAMATAGWMQPAQLRCRIWLTPGLALGLLGQSKVCDFFGGSIEV